MKVGSVSCVQRKTDLAQIISAVSEHTDLDLLLFSGWTVQPEGCRVFLRENVNPRTVVILQEDGNEPYPPCHVIQGRQDLSQGVASIRQLFADSKETTHTVLGGLLHALENERRIVVAGKVARLIICGENNLLKNVQSEGKRVSFRDDELANQFERIRSETDIFLNPAHTPM
jgi:hypothetical protein